MSNIKETDLFIPVKEWMEDVGYKVYSEVSPINISKRADIVGILNPITTVVELKTSLSLDLIEQSIDWIPHANYIYAAVPRPKKRYNQLSLKILKQYGIGLIEVDLKRGKSTCLMYPRMNRRVSSNIKDSLTEYHEKYSPDGGSTGGGYITEYRITMIKVKEFLTKVRSGYPIYCNYEKIKSPDGWVDIKTILEYCETHYASPKSSLAKALKEFEHEWCECKKENRKLYFRIKDENK